MKKGWSKRDFQWSFKWGLIFCVAQIWVCLLAAPKTGGLLQTYLRLNQWDSAHYLDIMDVGYHLPSGDVTGGDVHTNRANVGYFPAFPLFAGGVKKLTRLSSPVALLLTSQIFCFLFWSQVFLLLTLWRVSKQTSLWVGLTMAVFPAAFFLVAGYSESIFLAALMGVVLGVELWGLKSKWKTIDLNWFLAALSGFILSGSRLVGLPLMLYPLIQWAGTRKRIAWTSDILRVVLLCGVIASGGLLFFAWCQRVFGQWDIYLKLQRLGWGNQPNFLAILTPLSYIPRLFFEDTVNSVCRFSNFFILALFIWAGWVEYTKIQKKSAQRLGLYFAGFSMFFVSISGKANYAMDSMIRYNFPVFVVCVMALAQVYLENGRAVKKVCFNRFWIVGYLLAFAVQVWMIHIFTKGGWVA
jgi:hypothetical protein